MNTQNLSLELQQYSQWVLWRRELRDGKETKIPYRADGKGMASTTDAATWASFVDVTHAYAAGGYDGIGFVFTSNDPFTGIDIDHCRDPQTGTIGTWAQTIIDSLNSYSEITPSDTGVHIIVKGKLPPGGNRKGNIEMYDARRYFTITGNHLDRTPNTIEDKQQKLNDLHAMIFLKAAPGPTHAGGNGRHPVDLGDVALIQKAMTATNGAAFTSLWQGDTSAHGGDDSAADMALCNHLAFWTGNDPARIDTLFRQSGLYREKWERADYRALTIERAIENTSETYKQIPITNTVKYELPDFHLTDAGNAEYLIYLYGGKLRYDHRRSRWLEWGSHYWREDSDNQIMRLALNATRRRYREAVNIADLELREKVAKWAIGSEQRARLEAMIAIAKALKPIADSGESWDSNGWLFCVTNGVIDLKTGLLRDGKQEDMITRQAPVAYNPKAKAPLWQVFLGRITDGDTKLQSYLRRAVGYSLTGDNKNQVFFLAYGLGNNGKSTFLNTIRKVMGEYSHKLDVDDIMLKDKRAGGGAKEGLADLQGKRFVLASEIQDGKHLDVGLIKDMTGGETIRARRLYEHEVEYQPTHKLWLMGNKKPVITETTVAIWRRVKLIPFTVAIPDKEIDLDYPLKLEAELPGILNWAIEGCLEWQQYGLREPDTVTTATATYRHDSDILGDFIDDCCQLEATATVTKSEFKEAYEAWCKDNSSEPITQRTFKDRLIEKGIGEGRSGKARLWRGIRLKIDSDDIISDNNDKSDKTADNSSYKMTTVTDSAAKPPHVIEKSNTLQKNLSLLSFTHETEKVLSQDFAELPDCPDCGRNEWAYSPDGELLCPCGKSFKGGEQ